MRETDDDRFSIREEIGYDLLLLVQTIGQPEKLFDRYEVWPGADIFDLPSESEISNNEVFYHGLEFFSKTLDEIAERCLNVGDDLLIHRVHAVVEAIRFQLSHPCVLFCGADDHEYCDVYLKLLKQLNDDWRVELQILGGQLIAEEKRKLHDLRQRNPQPINENTTYLGLTVDEADRAVIRAGKRLKFDSKAQWMMVRSAIRAGEVGIPKDAWLARHPGEKGLGSRAPDQAKNRLKQKLQNIGLTLDSGSSLKIIEWDGES